MGETHHADYTNYESGMSKKDMLEQLVMSYEALSSECTNWVANLSNCASLLWYGYHSLGVPINWAGFYVDDADHENQLILGPFQGKVACQTIEFGKGVCGSAISSNNTQLVRDVNTFPGHIACDGDTKSEIVVPIVSGDKRLGVLDIDCLDYNGFDECDQQYLEKLVSIIIASCKF